MTDGWTRITKGAEMPIGWVLIAVRLPGAPPDVWRAYWDHDGKPPRWRLYGSAEMPTGVRARYWHPMIELPEGMR
jgi:hypothetical protein